MSRIHDLNRSYGQRSALIIQPLSKTVASDLGDDEIALELDEPPDHHLTNSPHVNTRTIGTLLAKQDVAREYTRQPPISMERKFSLITQGLLSTTNLQDAQMPPDALMARAGSQASAYSLSSNHGLTSDGGFSSPAHSGTPSPPLPAALQAPKITSTKTIKFAGEKTTQTPVNQPLLGAPARKTCISFACPPSRTCNDLPEVAGVAPSAEVPKRPCTIRFACSNNPPVASPVKPVTPPKKQSPSETHSTPRRGASPFPSGLRRHGSQSNPAGLIPDREKTRNSTNLAHSPSELRKMEKQRLKRLGSTRPEDEAWINEQPKERKPITVTDTLRKENAIRQLAAEAEQEAIEEALDDLIDEEEDDDPATGSRYMAFDEDDSDGGHETDDEGGFAESDDDSDDDPDFQFWTACHSTAATSAERHPEIIRPKHGRSVSESSFDSAFKPGSSSAVPMPPAKSRFPVQRRMPKEAKMRPGTPELPDSTDFVCGTLDEDKPLEEAYLSCLKQRKLEKQGIIPQDLDPSFPTSDPENNDDEEDEVTEGDASTASDHHFLGGRFDESDSSQQPGQNVDERLARPYEQRHLLRRSPPVPRSGPTSPALPILLNPNDRSPSPMAMQRVGTKSPVPVAMQRVRTKSPAPIIMQRIRTKSPAPVAMQRVRTKSPAPVAMQRARTKSPAPTMMQKLRPKSPAPTNIHNVKAMTPTPRNLFGRSPVRPVSPLPAAQIRSPPASPKNIKIQTSGLAERPGHVKTASLPHTPNPFFVIQERRLRASKKKLTDNENHDRGPVDIKQGLEQRKQRRKEHYWRKHCRDHKDKSRRCAPGKGAERMRELGLEMAHRNKAYGQKLQLMLSV